VRALAGWAAKLAVELGKKRRTGGAGGSTMVAIYLKSLIFSTWRKGCFGSVE
jgi:hypothetical protein